jgi:hypothetical protein
MTLREVGSKFLPNLANKFNHDIIQHVGMEGEIYQKVLTFLHAMNACQKR